MKYVKKNMKSKTILEDVPIKSHTLGLFCFTAKVNVLFHDSATLFVRSVL